MSPSTDNLVNWDHQNPEDKEQTHFPVVLSTGPTLGCLYIYIYLSQGIPEPKQVRNSVSSAWRPPLSQVNVVQQHGLK